MKNPTGGKIRNDPCGAGHYGAKRGNRKHFGLDLMCEPHQPVKAPISGHISREIQVYEKDATWRGVEIVGARMTIKLFYLIPSKALIGTFIKSGDLIGYAQDISKKYGKPMTSHIHVEIVKLDPEVLLDV